MFGLVTGPARPGSESEAVHAPAKAGRGESSAYASQGRDMGQETHARCESSPSDSIIFLPTFLH